MYALLLLAALGAEPKPVSGSEYYAEAVEVLDNAKNDKALAAAVVKLNKKWSKKRIVVEFQVTDRPLSQMFYDVKAIDDDGDWMVRCMRDWLPNGMRPIIGSQLTFTGTPLIGGKKETAIGTIHAGGQPIPLQLTNYKVAYKEN